MLKDMDATKLMGLVLAIVVQSFSLYSYFMNEIDKVKDEVRTVERQLVTVEKTLLTRSKYIEVADTLTEKISQMEKELADINYSLLEQFRKTRALEEKVFKYHSKAN